MSKNKESVQEARPMKYARQLELLAPAGSWKALEAAVYSGADAVYL